jgi:YkoY family integral membrane protein
MLGQTFEPADIGTIALLVLLEGVLSVDNALVLSALASRLPGELAKKALGYGIAAALVFRLAAVAGAVYLLRWPALRPVAALYLIYLVIRRFFFSKRPPRAAGGGGGFWQSVAVIELTDLAFAVDNILAAVALVGPAPVGTAIHPKFWVILTGGMLGVILMRFGAVQCLKLLRRFPRLDACAYLIVLLVAIKLGLEWMGWDFQDAHRAPFRAFWCAMAAILAGGLAWRGTGALPFPPARR